MPVMANVMMKWAAAMFFKLLASSLAIFVSEMFLMAKKKKKD